MSTIFIGPKDAIDELAEAVTTFLGRDPLQGEADILLNGTFTINDSIRWFGIEPVAGTVNLKAPIYDSPVEPRQWVEYAHDQDGTPMFHNTSDLMAVRIHVTT